MALRLRTMLGWNISKIQGSHGFTIKTFRQCIKLGISGRTILAAPSCDPSLGPPLAVRADHRHDVVLQVDTVEAGHPRVRPGASVADERIQRGVAELWVIESI